jgi:PKHD-type hydroxylase
MQLHNYYWCFKSAIDSETCQKIIDMGEAKMQEATLKGENIEATTFGDVQKGAMEADAEPQNDQPLIKIARKKKKTYIRDSNVSWLNEQWLYDLFYPYLHKANQNTNWNWNFDVSEPFQFTKYKKDQFYGWHADGQSDNPYRRYIHGITPEPLKPNGELPAGWVRNSNFIGKIRKLSMTVNLCPDNSYEGGDLKFDFGLHKKEEDRFHLCTEIRPQGSIIIFPSFLYHCVAPVTKGTRYSLVLWALGEKWK